MPRAFSGRSVCIGPGGVPFHSEMDTSFLEVEVSIISTDVLSFMWSSIPYESDTYHTPSPVSGAWAHLPQTARQTYSP